MKQSINLIDVENREERNILLTKREKKSFIW